MLRRLVHEFQSKNISAIHPVWGSRASPTWAAHTLARAASTTSTRKLSLQPSHTGSTTVVTASGTSEPGDLKNTTEKLVSMLLQENNQDPNLCIAVVSPNFQDADQLHKFLPPSFTRTLIGASSSPTNKAPKLSLTAVTNPALSTQFFYQNHSSLPALSNLPNMMLKEPPVLLSFASKHFHSDKKMEQFMQRMDFAFQSTPKVAGISSSNLFFKDETHTSGIAGCSISGFNGDALTKLIQATFGNEVLDGFYYNPVAGSYLFKPTKKLLMVAPRAVSKPLALPASSKAEVAASPKATPDTDALNVVLVPSDLQHEQSQVVVSSEQQTLIVNSKLRVPIVYLQQGTVFPRQVVDRPLVLLEPRYRLMIKNCVENRLPFGIMYQGSPVGVLVGVTKIFKSTDFGASGHTTVAIAGLTRFKMLTEVAVEDDSFGLDYAEVECFEDTISDREKAQNLVSICAQLTSSFFQQPVASFPTDPVSFSWHLCRVLEVVVNPEVLKNWIQLSDCNIRLWEQYQVLLRIQQLAEVGRWYLTENSHPMDNSQH